MTDLTHDNAVTAEPASGPSRLQQAGIVGAVALVIIFGAIWIARDQGAGQLGQGGVNSALLPSVGEPAPEFMTLYADGEIMRLSELKGQPVWLNFWGAWCAPCRAEMPELQAAWQILEPQGVKMIGVSLKEDPRESVAYADRVGATFPIAVDPNFLAAVADPEAFPDLFETAETWEIRNFPTHVFIDADGIVRSVILSQMDTETAVAEGEALLERTGNP
ncbi:MAG: TlpA family protein disulfide reductase [Chloroflexia bacterium]|nr:TlpA family protein disulfide reductase [Chloroflexia bacterium]